MYLKRLKELKRIYPMSDTGELIVNIQLDVYRDVYSEWDYSPFNNRDLDEDFVEFLLDCSYEIGHKYPMKVTFHLPRGIENKKREERSTKGIRHYFAYQYKRNRNYMVRVIWDTLLFFMLGTILIIASTILDQSLPDNLFKQVLIEGLYIGGWVMLWEMFSSWFFEVNKYRKKLKHFKRLESINYDYYYTEKL